VDRAGHNVYGESRLPGDALKQQRARREMTHTPVCFSFEMRRVVHRTIREVCHHRNWPLYALNVQTNHVHLVVASAATPERIMDACKAWATRRLREDNLVSRDARVWSRHGSTKYLWVENQINHAMGYVLYDQPLPPSMDDPDNLPPG